MHPGPYLFFLLFVGLLVTSANAQTHLPALQQSYDKAIEAKATVPYQAAIAELNQKYSAAIERLTMAATQAGDLDGALALREEKSRLLPEGSLPADTETTPDALKAARATYRQQIATLITQLPKAQRITHDLERRPIAEVPDFSPCKTFTEINLETAPSPTAEVVAKCSGTSGLKLIRLITSQIDPATISALLSFKSLAVLSRNDCKFTPDTFAALPQLKALKTLKELNLKNSGVPPDDLSTLKKALSKCLRE